MVARLVRLVFPFTLRGLLFTVLAGCLLAAGVIRADLAALFWGASFLLYACYALVGSHILRLSLLARYARDREMVSIVLPSEGLFPGEEVEAKIEARLPRGRPPGFLVHVRLPLQWQERRMDEVSAGLLPGRSSRVVRFSAPWRGAYASAAAALECRDVLGFTEGRASVPLRETLTVYPGLRDPGSAARFMEHADEAASESRQRRRTDDLLEARKYYPGDDPRRLSWKILAHLNELFVRVGEEVPPPEARLLFVLDTTMNPLVPRAGSADYLDGLVSTCVSVMDALQDESREVLLSQPGQRDCRGFGSRAALLAHAADAAWTDAPWAPDLPARRMHAAVFSSPGSPGLARIMSALKSRGWSASLFIKVPDPASPAARRRLRELLFLPRPGQAPRRPARGEEEAARALADAAAADLAAYGGGKVKHAVAV
jgi:uncharacterized protein (DUF58 family)